MKPLRLILILVFSLFLLYATPYIGMFLIFWLSAMPPSRPTEVQMPSQHPEVGILRTVPQHKSVVTYKRPPVADFLRVDQALTAQQMVKEKTRPLQPFLPAGRYQRVQQFWPTYESFSFSEGHAPEYCDGRKIIGLILDKHVNTLYFTTSKGPCGGWDKGFSVLTDQPLTNEPMQQRELIYDGFKAQKVYFSFGNSVLTHDMAEGNILRFRGGEIEIQQFDDSGITYKILKNLDKVWEEGYDTQYDAAIAARDHTCAAACKLCAMETDTVPGGTVPAGATAARDATEGAAQPRLEAAKVFTRFLEKGTAEKGSPMLAYWREPPHASLQIRKTLRSRNLAESPLTVPAKPGQEPLLHEGNYQRQRVDGALAYYTATPMDGAPPTCGSLPVTDIVYNKTEGLLFLQTKSGLCGGWDMFFRLVESETEPCVDSENFALSYEGKQDETLLFFYGLTGNRQRLTLDMSKANTLQVQGAEVRIDSYSNTEVTFTLLKTPSIVLPDPPK